MRPRRTAALLLLAGLLLPVAGSAQEAPPPGGAPPLWWLRNAQTVQPRPAGLLVHAEGQYAWARLRGNLRGSQHDGAVSVVLRKGLLNLASGGSIQKQKATIIGGRGSIEHEALMLDVSLRYDVHRMLAPQVGYIFNHDESAFIDARRIYYGGVNVLPVTNERLQTRVLLAAGHQEEEFTVAEPARDASHGYLGSEVQWSVTPKLRLQENSSYLFELGNMDNHRWILSLGADISVTRYFGIALQHHVTFDNEPVPSIASKRDARQAIMLRLMY